MKLGRVTWGVLFIMFLLLSTVRIQAAETIDNADDGHSNVSILLQSEAAGIVTTGALNVRTGPAVVYEVIGILKQGDAVSLLGRNDNGSWVLISTNDGLEGWVSSSYLQTNTPVASLAVISAPPPTSAVGIVNTGALKVRYGPGTSFEVITVLKGGEMVNLLGRFTKGSWVYIQTAEDDKGWVNGTYLITSVPIPTLPIVSEGD